MTRKIGSLLRYHFKTDPYKLTPFQFASQWRELQFALDWEVKRHEAKPGETLIL